MIPAPPPRERIEAYHRTISAAQSPTEAFPDGVSLSLLFPLSLFPLSLFLPPPLVALGSMLREASIPRTNARRRRRSRREESRPKAEGGGRRIPPEEEEEAEEEAEEADGWLSDDGRRCPPPAAAPPPADDFRNPVLIPKVLPVRLDMFAEITLVNDDELEPMF